MQTEGLSGPAAKITAVVIGASAGQADLPMTILGFTVADWAAGLTAIYVAFQIIVILPAVVGRARVWYSKGRQWLRKGK